jgi:hypothetical protein
MVVNDVLTLVNIELERPVKTTVGIFDGFYYSDAQW